MEGFAQLALDKVQTPRSAPCISVELVAWRDSRVFSGERDSSGDAPKAGKPAGSVLWTTELSGKKKKKVIKKI